MNKKRLLKLAEIIEENEELNALFALQNKRMDKATKLWQEATGKRSLPDLGQLLECLMSERTRLIKEAAKPPKE